MNDFLFRSISLLLLLWVSACSPAEEQNNNSDVDTVATGLQAETFLEVIEEIQESNKLEENGMHSDTMQFLSYNGDYDYAYVVLINRTGDTLSIVCSECMDEADAGRWFVINWEMDTLYEAGEGDEPYLKEVLRSYHLVE